ncbi:hydroxylysine kinase-like [Pomacea canaliculata]|uniref:hydroxylysine kinase-like n=1 Tax=Pomacea canaliculata TaxID=400727 RepID=UPI000D7334CE|nr:hydroxylysine kinase-like [Pomacea canaliculata]
MFSDDSCRGTLFRPDLSPQSVCQLVQQVYGLHVISCDELDSYDDRNFHITVDSDYDNKHLDQLCPHGYVLKVLNSLDSRKPELTKVKTDVILHACQRGFPTPRPVPTTKGQLYSLEVLEREGQSLKASDTTREVDTYLVRLFDYLPGETLASQTLTADLCFEVGQYAGLLDKALKDFDTRTIPELLVKWNLANVPHLLHMTQFVKDTDKMDILSEVISAFNVQVLQQEARFQSGIIHSDFNDYNILVRTTRELPSETHVCGLLDFGDSTKSLYVFEVAIAMAYMILKTPEGCNCDEMAGHVLAGYLSQVQLTKAEVDILPLVICARFSQSLILGYHMFSLDPSNQYTLVHARKVWPHLLHLWQRPVESTLSTWRQIVLRRNIAFPCH